jgi:uncharacterized protein DUF5667
MSRRADEFARLLDTAGAAGRGASVTTTDPALAPLVGLAQALRTLPLGPTPDFRDGLRQRLVAVATVQGIGAGAVTLPAPAGETVISRANDWASNWRRRRRFTVATATMSVVALAGAVLLAGHRSLPGDPFYKVKRETEAVQLAFTFGTAAKGERHLQFARTRLHEVQELVHAPSALPVVGTSNGRAVVAAAPAFGGSLSSRVISTLSDMDSETRAGTSDLTQAYASSHDRHDLDVIVSFATDQFRGLRSVYASLPASAQPHAKSSARLISQVAVRAHQLMVVGACTAECGAQQTPGADKPKTTDTLGPKPCTCISNQPTLPVPGLTATPTPTPTTTAAPEPTRTRAPGNGDGPGGGATEGPTASPEPTTLGGQLGSILSQLPLPVTPPPVPIPLPTLPVKIPPLKLLPSPLPTIRLP